MSARILMHVNRKKYPGWQKIACSACVPRFLFAELLTDQISNTSILTRLANNQTLYVNCKILHDSSWNKSFTLNLHCER
jgi:hypothetical protein